MKLLQETIDNVKRIKEEYKDEPELLNFYLYSAEHFVKLLSEKDSNQY